MALVETTTVIHGCSDDSKQKSWQGKRVVEINGLFFACWINLWLNGFSMMKESTFGKVDEEKETFFLILLLLFCLIKKNKCTLN